ncbi:MAG: bifunctional nuclease family protein [Halobacteria archaeon]
MANSISVNVKGVYILSTISGPTPVVLLADDKERIVPIYIGFPEAISINAALKNEVSPRPMTHDLIMSILNTLGARIIKIVIDDLDEQIYYARLYVSNGDEEANIDARPSDCIALAIRASAPIYIEEDVIDKVAITKREIEGARPIDSFLNY